MTLQSLDMCHAEIVAEMHKECFSEHWSTEAFLDLISLPASFGFVISSDDDHPQGFILCQGDEQEAEIITIATRPKWRRQGIAHRLLDSLKKQSQKFFLEVADDNPTAIAFYLNEGFIQHGIRKNYYKREGGLRMDARVMVFEAS